MQVGCCVGCGQLAALVVGKLQPVIWHLCPSCCAAEIALREMTKQTMELYENIPQLVVDQQGTALLGVNQSIEKYDEAHVCMLLAIVAQHDSRLVIDVRMTTGTAFEDN